MNEIPNKTESHTADQLADQFADRVTRDPTSMTHEEISEVLGGSYFWTLENIASNIDYPGKIQHLGYLLVNRDWAELGNIIGPALYEQLMEAVTDELECAEPMEFE